MKTVALALFLATLTLFSFAAEETIPPIEVPLPQAFEIRGEVRFFDRGLFPWSAVEVFDTQGNRIYMFQVDDLGQFVFPALAGETYLVRGAQGGYGYAPAEIKLENVTSSRSDLVMYAGPGQWFPPMCEVPAAFTTWVKNPPCYFTITPTAEGTSATGEPEPTSTSPETIRIFILPNLSPSPSPTPTPTPTPESSPTATPTPTPTPTPEPTPTPTPAPPTPTPTPQPTPEPTPTPGPCTTRLPNGKCKKGCVCRL